MCTDISAWGGDSGAGIFSQSNKLVGIISRSNKRGDDDDSRTGFVPSTVIQKAIVCVYKLRSNFIYYSNVLVFG